MAKSSEFSTSNQYIVYWLEVTENSKNIDKNTSNVTVKVGIRRTNSGYTTYGTGTVTTVINGTKYTASITPSEKITSSPRILASYTVNISHNNDGKKTLNMSAQISHQQFSSSSHSYSYTLSTIPRTSSFKICKVGTDTEISSVNAGDKIKISINRASSSFKHNIWFRVGGTAYATPTNIDTSTDITISMDCLNKITNSTSGTGTIYVDTMNGSTKIGTTSKNITINVPSSVKPNFSFNLSRNDNGVPSGWGVYVKGKSKANLSITNVSKAYSSNIVSYSMSGGGYSSSGTSFTTGVLNTVGTVTFTATIKDERGRVSEKKTQTCTVVDYNNPTISLFKVARCNSSGTEMDEGNNVKIILNASCSPVNNKNSIHAKIQYKQTGSTSWTDAIALDTNQTPKVIGNNGISPDHSYDLLLTVWDGLTTITKTSTIQSSSTVLDFKNGGTGIAVGKVSERDGFEVGWPSYFTQLASFGNGLTANKNITLTSGNRFVVNGSSNNLEMGSGSSDVFFRNTTSNKYLTLNNNGNLIYDGKNVAFQSQSEALWQGYHHMSKNETVTPSKRLSQCANGWIIVWSDWNDGGKGENFNFVYSYVPKNTPWKSGQNHSFPLSAGEGDKGYTCKTLYIYDDKFTGHDTNKQGSAYDIVIRAVLEY